MLIFAKNLNITLMELRIKENSLNQIMLQSQKTIPELVKEVIEGKWGKGEERKKRLTAAGYDYSAVQARVNHVYDIMEKDITILVREIIAGKWGNGEERKKKLTEAGYNYDEVQALVNKILEKKGVNKK